MADFLSAIVVDDCLNVLYVANLMFSDECWKLCVCDFNFMFYSARRTITLASDQTEPTEFNTGRLKSS